MPAGEKCGLVLCLQGETALAYCGGDYDGGGPSPPRPLDSDCDNVPDDNDLCPQIQGLESNAGCPVDVELVVVTGIRGGVVCPDGAIAAHQTQCAGFRYWGNSYTRLLYNPQSRQVSTLRGATACGDTVDASCACGAGKVKVYDEDDNTFHCKTEPPAAGCPKWGQTFDFDPGVWKCTMVPLDANAEDAAERIKKCVGGLVSKHWNWIERNVSYNSALVDDDGNPAFGAVACVEDSSGRAFNVSMQLNNALFRNPPAPFPSEASHWQYLAHTQIHETIHVDDHLNYGCEPWTHPTVRGWLNVYELSHTEMNYEILTQNKAWGAYEQTLGARSPMDPDYNHEEDGAVSCLLH